MKTSLAGPPGCMGHGCGPGRLALISVALFVSSARAEWPMYRGPAGDGVSTERIRTDWNTSPPTLLWRKPLTNGLSSAAISGGRVFTQVRRESTEFCIALDARDGQSLWTAPVGQASYPNGGVNDFSHNDDGPRSTPAVKDGRVYVLGSYLDLHCLDAANGTNIWSKDLRAELGGSVIAWQNAASPLLEGDLLLLNCNASPHSLVALRETNVVWRLHDERMTHATPVPATLHGERQVIFLTQSGLVAVRPSDGRQLWRYTPIRYDTSIAASPVVDGEIVYYAGAYTMGSSAARITKNGTNFMAQQIWPQRSSRRIHWSTPVAVNGFIYGLFGANSGQLNCLDVSNGDYRWEGPQFGLGATLLVDGKLMVAAENGEMVLVEPDPTEYREIGRFEAVNGRIWNSPAISDGVLYVRGTTELAAYDVSLAPPPALSLEAVLDSVGGAFLLEIANTSGQPIEAGRVPRIGVMRSGDPTLPVAEWTAAQVSLTLEAGVLRGGIEWSGDEPEQFFVVREN